MRRFLAVVSLSLGWPVTCLARPAADPPEFIRAWSVLGPVPMVGADALAANPLAPELADEGALTPRFRAAANAWRPVRVEQDAVDLQALLGDYRDVIAYAYTRVHLPEDYRARLYFGSDDGAAVLVNGERVLATPIPRDLRIDQDVIDVDLRAGWNDIVVKVLQFRHAWGFALRLESPTGLSLVATQDPEADDDPEGDDDPSAVGSRRSVAASVVRAGIAADCAPVADRLGKLQPGGDGWRGWNEAAELVRSLARVGPSPTATALSAAVARRLDEARQQCVAIDCGDLALGELDAAAALAAPVVTFVTGATAASDATTVDGAAGWIGRDRLRQFLTHVENGFSLLSNQRLEAELLRAADRAIEGHRMSDGSLTVQDAAGNPVAGAVIEIRQLTSDFRFGGNLYLYDRAKRPDHKVAYAERFADLFNAATTDLYWNWYEPEQGSPDYAYTDKVVAWCAERGIRLKGHPILWRHEHGEPRWASHPPPIDLQKRRIDQLLGRYMGKIQVWDVVNEPAHTNFPLDQPYRWARAADPLAELIVNDYGVFDDGYPKFRKLLEGMIERKVPFDGVGIQGHWPLDGRYSLAKVSQHLDDYAKLGKPLHITELVVASGGQPIVASHLEGHWNEVLQADYVERLYRVLFSHPAVVAVTWWDLSDQKSWQPGCGLLRADMSPKPAYEALRRLITERWRTRLTVRTDAEGKLQFRGFQGRYAIEAGGSRVEAHLRKGGLNTFALTIGAPEP